MSNWQLKNQMGEYYLESETHVFYLDTNDKREAHYWLAMADIYVFRSLQNMFLQKKGFIATIVKKNMRCLSNHTSFSTEEQIDVA